MDFLKKDIFYPVNNKYDDNLIKSALSNYGAYLDKIKNELPSQLYKAYITNDQFHDYVIKKIAICGNAQCYGAKSDKVSLELVFEEIEILIEFDRISFVKLMNDGNSSCWISVAQGSNQKEPLIGLEEVVLCELGIVNEKVYKVELLSSSGLIFEIHFGKVKIAKRIRKY